MRNQTKGKLIIIFSCFTIMFLSIFIFTVGFLFIYLPPSGNPSNQPNNIISQDRFNNQRGNQLKDRKSRKQANYANCTYYTTDEGYISSNNYKKAFDNLLENSKEHFDFNYFAGETTTNIENEEFVLVNLENNYCRLTNIFEKTPTNNIDVFLTHDIELFYEELGKEYDMEDVLVTAYAEENTIEIFHTLKVGTDRDIISSTLSHELVHIFQFQEFFIMDEDSPLWYLEGMAEAYAHPKTFYNYLFDQEISYNKMKEIIFDEEDLPDSLEEVTTSLKSEKYDEYSTAYDTAHLFFMYLDTEYGRDNVISLLDYYNGPDFALEFKKLLNTLPEEEYISWRQDL